MLHVFARSSEFKTSLSTVVSVRASVREILDTLGSIVKTPCPTSRMSTGASPR